MKLSFQEPVTVFCYNLIALHHDILWYIILIISLVFWVLAKILKEFSWYAFKKEKKLIYIYNNIYFLQCNAVLFYVWLILIFYPLKVVFNVYKWFQKGYEIKILKEGKKGFFYNFLLGKEVLDGLYFPTFIKDWDLNFINFLMIERFLSYVLFNKASNALYFYDGRESYLVVERFKHSTILEYVYGLFPSIIIAFILLPSLYLLYSADEDIDPSYTIKVVGHQWFWSYEYSGIALNLDNVRKEGHKEHKTLQKFNINFDSVLINDEDLIKGYKRLLDTDKILLVPSHRAVRFVILLRMYYIHEQYLL